MIKRNSGIQFEKNNKKDFTQRQTKRAQIS